MAEGVFQRLIQTKAWRGYKRYAAPAMAVGFGILDVAISENKGAAIFSNIAASTATFAVRNMTSLGSLLIPTIAYFGARKLWESFFPVKKYNKAVNPIKGHDAGHWGRDTTFASGDFKPGSSWTGIFKTLGRLFTRAPKAQWGKITEITKPLVELAKGKTAAQFVEAAPIEKVLVPEVNFPVKYFGKVGAGRTMTMEAAGIQEAVPMITAPEALQAGQLIGRLGEIYKGTAVHEIAEAAFAFSPFAMSKRGARFLKLFGHYSPDVVRAEGLFMQQIGITAKELRAMSAGRINYRLLKQGWKYGERLGSNVAGNTISGLSEGGIASIIRKKHGFGSGWQGLATKVLEPLIGKFAKYKVGQITAREFAEAAGVRLMEAPTEAFGIKKFLSLKSGRTIFETSLGTQVAAFKQVGGVSATTSPALQRLIQKGKVTPIPAVASPEALKAHGIEALNETSRKMYASTMIHEKAEAIMVKAGRIDKEFLSKYGHAHADVLRMHGYFMHGAGYELQYLRGYLGHQPDMIKYLEEGWKYRALKMETRKAAEMAEARLSTQTATQAAKMANDLQKARLAQTLSIMSQGPLRPAGLCQRLNAQRNGSKCVRRDFENR